VTKTRHRGGISLELRMMMSQTGLCWVSRPGPERRHGLLKECSLNGGMQSSLLIVYYLFSLNL
jgi:hypothetical protein